MIVGHEPVVAALKAELPPVALLQGPESVGKWTIANEVVAHHGISGLMLRTHTTLRADDVRELIVYASTLMPNERAAVIGLDGVGRDVQNALLKTLEEPPARMHFLLVASRLPMLTIASRAQVFRCGYLTDDQIVAILMARGIDYERALATARCANGQVGPALALANGIEFTKGPVISALRGAANGDEDLFWSTVSGKREITLADGSRRREDAFGPVQWKLLQKWAVEALTGRWRMFTPSESSGLHRDPRVAQRVLRFPGVRPRVGAAAALLPFLLEHRHA